MLSLLALRILSLLALSEAEGSQHLVACLPLRVALKVRLDACR
jgi:hypothetical protein